MKAVRSISAIVLATLVLVSSTSLMIGLHLCMGEVRNIAVFSEAEGCEKEQNIPPCHRHSSTPCCDDETVIHKGDDFQVSIIQDHVVAPVLTGIALPFVLISEIIPSAPLSRFKFRNYDPPLRSCDITVAAEKQ